MEHSFCIEIASILGIEEAILINNFFYWIKKNEANDKHFHYGRYWTYNTTKALAELFPYMNEKKISRLINNLVEKGIFIKDNFNSSAYDRTCWYAFSDEGISMIKKWGMHFSKMGNGFPEYVQPIPDSNTDNKQEKEELVQAMEASGEVESLYRPIHQKEGSEISLLDKLEEKEHREEKILDRMLLGQLLEKLDGQERTLIYLRYFAEKTQSAVGKEMGISQVQVSRMEKKIIQNLREMTH